MCWDLHKIQCQNYIISITPSMEFNFFPTELPLCGCVQGKLYESKFVHIDEFGGRLDNYNDIIIQKNIVETLARV